MAAAYSPVVSAASSELDDRVRRSLDLPQQALRVSSRPRTVPRMQRPARVTHGAVVLGHRGRCADKHGGRASERQERGADEEQGKRLAGAGISGPT